jgi:hypothetical protein
VVGVGASGWGHAQLGPGTLETLSPCGPVPSGHSAEAFPTLFPVTAPITSVTIVCLEHVFASALPFEQSG